MKKINNDQYKIIWEQAQQPGVSQTSLGRKYNVSRERIRQIVNLMTSKYGFTPVKKNCLICFKEFNSTHSDKIYCSKKCRDESLVDYQMEYRKNHKEQFRQYNKEYFRNPANKEKRKNYQKRYYYTEEGKKYYKKYRREYYLKNKEKVNAVNKIWRKNNPERVRIINKKAQEKYRAKFKKAIN